MDTTTAVLTVPDISCEHCVKTINGALGKEQGVVNVNTDIPTKTVTLVYEPATITMAHIEKVLDDAGYAVAK